MSVQPRISVIVPVYNVAPYLGSCISSLVSQDVDGLEVIAVNDGSTDGSGELLHDLVANDSRVIVIDKPNSGYGASVNQGIAAATGEYVGILESDDEMCAGALTSLLGEAHRLHANVVKGDYIEWWPDDPARTHVAGIISQSLCGKLVDTRHDLRIYSRKSTIWSAVYRREHLAKNQVRFLETPGASYQDTSFNFKAFASSSQTAFVTTPIVRYRQGREGSSVSSHDKADAVRVEFDEIDRWLAARKATTSTPQLMAAAKLERFNAYLWNLDRLDAALRPSFLASVASEFSRFERAGTLDLSSWDPWRLRNLRAIEHDSARYLRIREHYHGSGLLSKVRFALALGGPAALLAALHEHVRRS